MKVTLAATQYACVPDIYRFVCEHNAEPKPFTWTADPDRIIATFLSRVSRVVLTFFGELAALEQYPLLVHPPAKFWMLATVARDIAVAVLNLIRDQFCVSSIPDRSMGRPIKAKQL